MTEEVKVEEIEKTKDDSFVLTDELRKKATEKPKFNILYVGDGDTRLLPFRGEKILKTFVDFYERQADIEYYTISSKMFGEFKLDDLRNVNIIWADNVSEFKAVKNLSDLQNQVLTSIEPDWKKNLEELNKDENKDKAIEYLKELNKERSEKLRIVYSLDEFIWQGTVGRSRDVGTVQLMETFMSIADTVVVPTPELKEAIMYYKFIQDPNKDIFVVPSAVNADFFPLFKDFTKKGKAELSQLRDKPKILIKGLSIPKNVEEFIINNYKKANITICSVDEVNDHVMALIARRKINHIYHWANPYVNRRNISPTYAIERDFGFDMVIHTKPDNMKGDMYELTTGDEDILFSISYGALPICGIDHLGYEKDSNHLAMSAGVTFGKDTPAKKIAGMVNRFQTPALFNEVFNKCRQEVENRIATSPFIIARYFSVMLGRELSQARAAMSREKQEELAQKQKEEEIAAAKKVDEKRDGKIETEVPEKAEAKAETKVPEKPENVIEADFKQK